VFRNNIGPLVSYPTGVAVVVACAAVISIRIYQQPKSVQVAVESSPVPSTQIVNAERELDLPAPVMIPTFSVEPTLFPGRRNVPMLPSGPVRSDQFVPLKVEWESLDDRSLPGK
jgi:hypothetical protein